jgi:hypothetical protein
MSDSSEDGQGEKVAKSQFTYSGPGRFIRLRPRASEFLQSPCPPSTFILPKRIVARLDLVFLNSSGSFQL